MTVGDGRISWSCCRVMKASRAVDGVANLEVRLVWGGLARRWAYVIGQSGELTHRSCDTE